MNGAGSSDLMVIRVPRCTLFRYLKWMLLLCGILGTGGTLYYLRISSTRNTLPDFALLKPHDFNYAVMLDAGSSGTRVYLYRWPPGNTDGLLKIEQMKDRNGRIMVQKTSPGLSAYADNPMAAYQSIKSLLLYASLNIPNGKHKETPLYILCTAGMRLLAEEKRNNIMNAISSKVTVNFDFFFQPSHIEVIDGRMEGVYGWIAVNYILGRFDHTFETGPSRSSTVGALDMGGASTQITYEVPKSEAVPAGLSMDINLGCHGHAGSPSHTYHLYANTWLGFGANEARKRYVEHILTSNVALKSFTDPCLPKGMVETQKSDAGVLVQFTGSGNFTACRHALYPLLKIPTTCRRSPCSMNGAFQPPINFYNQEMYGFSEYWYTMDDILKIGGHYREEKFIKGASEFCSTPWNDLNNRLKSGEFPNADQHRFQYQCFKSAWVLAVLHDGHRFPSNYDKFVSAKTVNGEVVQWTYGALIYRTRYLPLREEGVDKMSSISVSRFDSILHYTSIVCFFVVLLAIIYWAYKLHKIRSSRALFQLPSKIQDISAADYRFAGSPKINYNDICAPPRTSGLLPRTFSDTSLLNRDIGGSKTILLGDH